MRESDIASADLFLKQFCCEFVRLYGLKNRTFNMHLHLHLKKTLLDFGPAHTSWCYAFERYNGLLGSYSTNNKSIEPQIMRRFCQHQAIYSEDMSCAEIQSILPHDHQQEDRSKTNCNSLFLLHYATNPLDKITTFVWTMDMKAIFPVPPFYEEIFTMDEADQLCNIYKQLYPTQDITPSHVPVIFCKFGRTMVAGDLIGSEMPASHPL